MVEKVVNVEKEHSIVLFIWYGQDQP